ncbi:MAG: hypothetical protein J5674_03265 [Candidatus Methanomethylophilaceae archaeon]|nr:hypothetical protein [Candidatus Methanomethylophilaceae archaeon]
MSILRLLAAHPSLLLQATSFQLASMSDAVLFTKSGAGIFRIKADIPMKKLTPMDTKCLWTSGSVKASRASRNESSALRRSLSALALALSTSSSIL